MGGQSKSSPFRRPPFQPERPWCCRCCQEAAQLEFAARLGTGDISRSAYAIFDRFRVVADGLYGGVESENLFD